MTSFVKNLKEMLVAERKNLTPVAVLTNQESSHLELLENSNGNLFISCQAAKPEGMICFATIPSLFYLFIHDLVDLQTLLHLSPSSFVEIAGPAKTTLFSRRDLEILLKHGDRSFSMLRDNASVPLLPGIIY